MIVFNQVNYGGFKELTFSIGRGEIVLFYSPEEGCFQDLRGLLSGEVKPESGFIRLPYNLTDLHSELGIVYRDNIFLPDRSLIENLLFIMNIKGVKRPYQRVRLKRLFQNLKLHNPGKALPGELSPYELLKANIVQALVTYPAFLIMEEPTRAIDEVSAQALIHLLERLNRLSLTILVFTSKPEFVRRCHQRTIQLGNIPPLERKSGFYA